MKRGKLLHETTVRAGSRDYLFSVKESQAGTKYLVLSEVRKSGKFPKTNQIMIFEEYIRSFSAELRKALKFINERQGKQKTYTVKEMRQRYHKAYAKWTQEEDKRLKREYASGKTAGELADILKRKPSAIRSRLEKLGLINK